MSFYMFLYRKTVFESEAQMAESYANLKKIARLIFQNEVFLLAKNTVLLHY